MIIRWSPSGVGLVCIASVFVLYIFRSTVLMSFPGWNSSSQINLQTLLCTSVLAAERGGLEVKRIHEAQLLNAKNKGPSEIRNPVTDGDIRSHFAMTNTFQLAFPDLRIISEEHGNTQTPLDINFAEMDNSCISRSDLDITSRRSAYVDASDLQVWIDPLDATQEYTENLLEYVTTMVGIAIKGRAVAGIIHKPFAADEKDRTYWAWIGHSSSENLKLTNQEAEKKVRIIVSRSHAGDVEKIAKAAITDSEVEMISAGGAGYKSLQVIAHKADMYLHTTKIKKWDLCAPNGILNALGGRLTTLSGVDIDYSYPADDSDSVNGNGVIAALHDHSRYVNIFKDVLKKA